MKVAVVCADGKVGRWVWKIPLSREIIKLLIIRRLKYFI